MGFKVTMKDITMPNFNTTVSRLYREKKFEDPAKAYRLKKLVKKLEQEQKHFWDMYKDLQEKYAIEFEEDGKKHKKIDPEKQEEFTEKIDQLGKTEVTIEWHALNLGDFKGFELSANEIEAIEPILDQASLDELQAAVPS